MFVSYRLSHLKIFTIIFLAIPFFLQGQIGGRYAFESVSLPSSARINSLGGSLISVLDQDVGQAIYNPALSNPLMNNQFGFNHNFHFAGISFGNAAFAKTFEKNQISAHASLQYVNYGTFTRSDVTGAIEGEFDGGEFGLIVGAGKQVNERIRAGVNLKFLSRNYESYSSLGLGADLGLYYQKSDSSATWGLLLRNIGTELGGLVNESRSLPFDLQLGYSKRLAHLPFRFSIIAHQLQSWYIRYYDPDFDEQVSLLGEVQRISDFSKQIDNFFRHIIFNGEFLIGKNEQLRLRFGYNHLRKQEMRNSSFRSMAGFSFGVGFNIKKIRIDYGIGQYHLAGANNHLSIQLNMDKIFNKI